MSWQRRFDTKTNEEYWYDSTTGNSSWDIPDNLSLPEGWERRTDADGDPFFYDTSTHTSQWEPPGYPAPTTVRNPMLQAGEPVVSIEKRRKTLTSLASKLKELANAEPSGQAKPAPAAAGAEAKQAAGAPELSFGAMGKLALWRGRGKMARRNMNLNMQSGLPVRELLQSMYKINRDKTVLELLVFGAFMGVFFSIVVSIHNVHLAASTNESLIDLLLDEEFPDVTFKKNFYDIMTMDELWEWIEGPLLGGLYPERWYNDELMNVNQSQYVLFYNRLVGGVRLRQMRVTNQSCSERRFETDFDSRGLRRFDTLTEECFAEFSSGGESKEAFGPNGTWTYTEGLSKLDGLFGFGPSYGTGGYVIELPTDRVEAKRIANYLKQNLWTDQATRAVSVDFNLYNTQTKMVTTTRILIEFFMSGHVVTSYKFFTYKMVVYQSKLDMFRIALEIIFFLFLCYFLQKEVRVLIYHKPLWKYFLQLQNVFEVVLLVLCMSLMGFWMMFITSNIRTNFGVNAPNYVDMFDFATSYINVISLAGFIGLLCCLKVFKFMSISKKMNALWLTLGRAAPDLVAFAIGFIFLVFGFAFMAEMMFGFTMMDFHNITAAFSTLLRYPLGDFNYDELARARPGLAGIFFSMYVAMVFLVCMNMIIGIVTLYFEEVHAELQTTDKWKLSTRSFEADVMSKTSFWCRKRCGFCVKISRSCCPADDVSSENNSKRRQSWAPLRRRQSTFSMDTGVDAVTQYELQEAEWKDEKLFLARMRQLMREARRKKNIDLFSYVDKIYQQFDDINLYVGIHEMCEVSRPDPCPPGKHVQCTAAAVIQAYNSMKEVTMVGLSKRHTPYSSRARTSMKQYRVMKVNRNGVKQMRLLCIDDKKGQLLNFSEHMRLRKAIPLLQLLQIEKNRRDKRRADLVFTSGGFDVTGKTQTVVEKLDELETTYLLTFTSESKREDFCAHILRAVDAAEAAKLANHEVDSDEEPDSQEAPPPGAGPEQTNPMHNGSLSGLKSRMGSLAGAGAEAPMSGFAGIVQQARAAKNTSGSPSSTPASPGLQIRAPTTPKPSHDNVAVLKELAEQRNSLAAVQAQLATLIRIHRGTTVSRDEAEPSGIGSSFATTSDREDSEVEEEE